MTTRAGNLVVGTVDKYQSGTETRPRSAYPGSVFTNATVVGNAPPIYKNQGYYVAGAAFETWISTPLPSTFPPSAHTLADISHDILESA